MQAAISEFFSVAYLLFILTSFPESIDEHEVRFSENSFTINAVTIPSTMPKRNRCSIAMAGIAMLRSYGQYKALPSAVEAISG